MDGGNVWHPNTQMREWGSFPRIVSARGVWLTDSRGRRAIDAVASMWCNVWGHSEPRLVGAMVRQAQRLQHSPLFNLTHGPAERLASRLVSFSPGMRRVFYSDNGSSGVEIAIKMALQYWQNGGGGRRARIASLEGGYHGDTFGAMSAGYVPEFFGRFRKKLFPAVRFPVPNPYRAPPGTGTGSLVQECLEGIERGLAGGDVAALVMESGAQVAGGVVVYPRGFQRGVARICRRHGVLLVLDEVATGLGRLGSMAEYTAQGGRPDIVVYGKMLTGGYLSMAATLATRRVYDSFLGEYGEGRHLFHGHTYTGNPLAAALACENLAMYGRRRLLARVKRTAARMGRLAGTFSDMGIVGDVRHRGLLMGIELVSDAAKKTPVSPRTSPNRILFEEGMRHGIYLRTLGNIVMLVPPLAITAGELDLLLERAAATIRAAAPRLLGGNRLGRA